MQQNSRLRKVVLLGDTDQLPSIDPGNLFKDLFTCQTLSKYSHHLTTNHRSEGTRIFDNAGRISRQETPIICRYTFSNESEKSFLQHFSHPRSEGFHLILPEDSALGIPGAVYLPADKCTSHNLTLVTSAQSQMDDVKVELVKSLLFNQYQKKKFGLEDHKKFQIIAFKK